MLTTTEMQAIEAIIRISRSLEDINKSLKAIADNSKQEEEAQDENN